jgi:hypothetical protein
MMSELHAENMIATPAKASLFARRKNKAIMARFSLV